MTATPSNPHALRRDRTSLIYVKATGRVLHIAHLDLMGGAEPTPELLAEIERNELDEACRIHGLARNDVATTRLDPEDFKANHIYSVDPTSGAVVAKLLPRATGSDGLRSRGG
jgi:hypothetical protein